MRPTWSGHIGFGLISIPVSLYSAVEASEHVSFRLLHRKDKAPIRYKKFCSKEDIEVPNDEIVKGFEVEKDQFAFVEKEELEGLESELSTGEGDMEVLQFVELGSVNPLSFQSAYYVAPRKGGDKAYAVLREALNESRRVGIVRFQLRERPMLAALIPGPRAIALESLRPFEELRDAADLPISPAMGKPAEVKMARLLIDQMATEGWDPTAHPNEYRKALEKLLASKRRFSLKQRETAAPDNVIDLMEALRKSVGQAKGRAKRAPMKAPMRRRGAA